MRGREKSVRPTLKKAHAMMFEPGFVLSLT